MVTVIFNDTTVIYDVYAFYQWDYGQQLQISGLTLEPTVEVHFAKPNTPAIVMLGETTASITTVKVPDSILQYAGEMSVYIYVATPTTAYTYKAITFQVRARERPRDYVEQVEAGITAQFINKLNAIIATGIASYTPDVSEVNTMIQNYVKANMITNNDAATVSGTAWDAVRGKAIRDDVTAINDNLASLTLRGTTQASVVKTISILQNHVYLLIIPSGSPDISSVYAITCLFSTPMVIPLKAAVSGVTITPGIYKIDLTTSADSGYVITDMTKFSV
jgi:hypothetical protein